MSSLTTVEIAPLPLERFREVLDEDGYRDLIALAQRARALLEGRVVWCANSTAHGGGVAEMLRSLLAFTRGAGVDTRWIVIDGTPEYFALTKRLHNCLHAAAGAIAPGTEDRVAYEAITDRAATDLAALVTPGDVVILHDPQTTGMAPAMGEAGAIVVWRSHVGIDVPDDATRGAWEFLEPYLSAADAYVFSRDSYAWDVLDPRRVVVIPPSIDVFSVKNQALDADQVAGILTAIGLLDGAPGNATFPRSGAGPGRVRRRADITQEAPLAPGDRVVTQVSRWDWLKDPVGVLEGFSAGTASILDTHLVLAGPPAGGVPDDPEGAVVLTEVIAAWRDLPAESRGRVHIACLPMEDADENAAMVNALQRYADVVVQKSIAEGFGLTVAEAMWKSRPVVVGGVGGILDQVTDGVNGLVIDPTDLAAFGAATARLLTDPQLAVRLARSGRDRVERDYLEPRHLHQWVDLVEHVLTTASRATGGPVR